jgi:hypothetical protein
MQKRIIEGVEVQRSSGNVFADLELPDAEKLKIKTGLVVENQEGNTRPWADSTRGGETHGHPTGEGIGNDAW